MQIAQYNLSHPAELAGFTPEQGVLPALVLIFGHPTFFTDSQVHSHLRRLFPSAHLAGASSAGNIVNAGLLEQQLQITTLGLPADSLCYACAHIPDESQSFAAGLELGQQLAPHTPHHVLLFSRRENNQCTPMLEGLKSQLPGIGITGGIACCPNLGPTHLLCNEGVDKHQAIAIGFCSSQIRISSGTSSGWKPFGPTRSITRCEGNILYELDGRPALDLIKRYLGDHIQRWTLSRLFFSFELLSSERKATGLIREVLNFNEKDGSLTLADTIAQGGFVRLMHANSNSMIDGAETAAERALHTRSCNAELALIFSCYGRRALLGHRTQEEIEAVHSVLPPNISSAGFYSYGEIGPVQDNNNGSNMLNETMAITLLGDAAC